jgi:hypothetical protein
MKKMMKRQKKREEEARGGNVIARASQKKSKQEDGTFSGEENFWNVTYLRFGPVSNTREKKFGPHKNKTHPRARVHLFEKKRTTTTTITL